MVKIVCAVVLGVCVILVIQQGASVLRDLYRAGTMNVEVSGADLREQCGYGRFEGELRGEPDEGCAKLIREFLRTAGTRGAVEALADGHSRVRVCVGELLDQSDAELARTYAEWVKRKRHVELDALPAEFVIHLVLIDKYKCDGGVARHGQR